MTDERDPEDLISEAIDAVALGYPYDRSPEEKAAWMAELQAVLESRAPITRAKMRSILGEG